MLLTDGNKRVMNEERSGYILHSIKYNSQGARLVGYPRGVNRE
jgi:hypothetical protein